jgi:GNAT superfamily N-acetyltransferase
MGLPESFELDEFLTQASLNFAAQVEQTALACDGRVEHWNGVSLCDARSPHKYRNMAVPTRALTSEESNDLAGRLVDFYGNRDLWVVASVHPLTPANNALVIDWEEELMVFPSGRVDVPERDDLEIREVSTAADMKDFEYIWATAYEKPHLLTPDARRYDERILGNGQRLWLGYSDGRPVATTASYVGFGFNLVRGVTTLHEHRGKGFGTTMTLQAMAAGEVPRYLNAEIGAENVYRRIGFQTVSRFRFWAAPGI